MLSALDFSKLPPGSTRYVVGASRGRFDEETVEQGIYANVAYIELVANRKRAREVLRALEVKGQAQEKLEVVYAPAGLDINAGSPQEIALSIMAQIVSEKKKRRTEP